MKAFDVVVGVRIGTNFQLEAANPSNKTIIVDPPVSEILKECLLTTPLVEKIVDSLVVSVFSLFPHNSTKIKVHRIDYLLLVLIIIN